MMGGWPSLGDWTGLRAVWESRTMFYTVDWVSGNRLPRYTIIPTSLTACHHEVHATQLCDRPAAHANRMADACSQKARHQTRAETRLIVGLW